MLNELFGRRARIIVGTQLLVMGDADDGLHVTFNIEKTLKPEPNKAEVSIWNLAKSSRFVLEQMAGVGPVGIPVQIEAGYEQTSLLFLGSLREAVSVISGPDIITTISTGDGEKEYQKSRINTSLPRGTPIFAALSQLALALKVLPGNLPAQNYQFIAGTAVFSNGTVLSGNAAWEMTTLLASCGKEWSIQNGAIQILDKNKTLLGTAVFLSSETGMIDSPSVNNKGELSVKSLLIPDIMPGRLLVMKSRHVNGTYRIEKCVYVGDTHGSDWNIDITAKRLGVV